MATDWIKMRIELQSHPKVVRILSALRADKFRVIGGLHAVWGVFDTHSVNGELVGYTPEALDHVIGWEGFANEMIKVGWLMYDGFQSLAMPEFTEHNGQSAKRRAEDQKRKRDARKCPQSVQSTADTLRTKSGLEKEKRESIDRSKDLSSRIDPKDIESIYLAYPRRVAKPAAIKAIAKALATIDPETLLARVQAYAVAVKGADMAFIPHPATWINGERYNDDPATWKHSTHSTNGKPHLSPRAFEQTNDYSLFESKF